MSQHSCTGLDQWERELQHFSSLKQLRIFRLYKIWKAFRVWKKAVNEAKFTNAITFLEKNLFMLSPVFQGPMHRWGGDEGDGVGGGAGYACWACCVGVGQGGRWRAGRMCMINGCCRASFWHHHHPFIP